MGDDLLYLVLGLLVWLEIVGLNLVLVNDGLKSDQVFDDVLLI